MKKNSRPNRKSITLTPILLNVMADEIKRRGGKTTYTALICEVLSERFAKEVRIKELELEANRAKFQR